ncbi:DUF1858 domain-containing protein [Caldisalinibacter kiritimatiensis]|uniref:DUF1858 domain-containing protein n=1 Tax=Caldisalinibacter kiritimatiensis TaxID=1304284 RepID=R1CWR9_9FIRM|nr:DUF1858 domain-containing protein [Caldisalinibacter kiritimatiensis]EOD01064.1 hypothetical protein L21TH_0871 [Caldisalinibacter kiritimatiensis]
MKRFTEDMHMYDIIKEDIRAIEVFERHGMNCSSCNAVYTGTLKDAAIIHHISINQLLDELNNLDKE